MRISDWSSDVCSSDLRSRDPYSKIATSAVPVASCALPTVTTCIPAALAAAMPAGESSQARQSPGATPSLAAAARKPSGAGLPFATSSAPMTSGGMGSPAAAIRTSASARGAEVTTAQGSAGRRGARGGGGGGRRRGGVRYRGKGAGCMGGDGPGVGGGAGEEGGRAGNVDDPGDFPYVGLGNRCGLAARIDARRREAQYGVMGPDAVHDCQYRAGVETVPFRPACPDPVRDRDAVADGPVHVEEECR